MSKKKPIIPTFEDILPYMPGMPVKEWDTKKAMEFVRIATSMWFNTEYDKRYDNGGIKR